MTTKNLRHHNPGSGSGVNQNSELYNGLSKIPSLKQNLEEM